MRIFTLVLIVLLAGLAAGPAFAATRFYLPSSGAAEVSPAFSAWTLTTGADRLKCVTTRTNTLMINKSTTTTSESVTSLLNRQYVSEPIGAQTITGTVKGQLRGMEDNAAQDMVSCILIKVVSNDGSTVRGTLLNFTYPALSGNEYGTKIANRYTPISASLTTVTAEAGDRIVIEIGAYRYKVGGSTGSCTQTYGDDSATDLPEDQTTKTAYNPWVEFSQTLGLPKVIIFID